MWESCGPPRGQNAQSSLALFLRDPLVPGLAPRLSLAPEIDLVRPFRA